MYAVRTNPEYVSDTEYIINVANNVKPPESSKISTDDFVKSLIDKGWSVSSVQYPTEVVPGIWISGIGFNDDIVSWCYYNGFSHIVNAAGRSVREKYYKTLPTNCRIKYLEIDLPSINIVHRKVLFNAVCEFIGDAFSVTGPSIYKQSKMLIHCVNGNTYSIICVLYFLMKTWNLSYDQAFRIIHHNQKSINQNSKMEQLVKSLFSVDN